MNWLFRLIGSLLVLVMLVLVLFVAESDVEPNKGKTVRPVQSEEDSSMKGMKIN